MLEYKLAYTTKYGKKSGKYHLIIYDKTWKQTWNPGMSQFVLDHSVRKMVTSKHAIEKLEAMPIFLLDDEDVTKQYLPDFIKSLETWLGKLNWNKENTEMCQGSRKYLEENNVAVGENI